MVFMISAFSHGQIDGFTEPLRSIELSSDESGAIAELKVFEGQKIKANEIVASLDQRTQQIQLEIARQMVKNQSQIFAAEQAYRKRLAIHKQLEKLNTDGHASQSELIQLPKPNTYPLKKKNRSAKSRSNVPKFNLNAEISALRLTVLSHKFIGNKANIFHQLSQKLSPGLHHHRFFNW